MNNKILPFVLVAQNNVAILERFGRFSRALAPGLQFKIPFVDVVAYHHTMKEQILEIESQTAITKDNVKIKIDGVLYFKITDAMKASYEISDPIYAISLLAQTSMRSEIGLLELDRTFEERDHLNVNIKRALNDAG
jgi:regulator of protease activity HflC (stomatin/prohibitin superfamily)